MTIYDITCKTIAGKEESLADYEGKVLLVVNTASKCGFTPQYEELEKLYRKYKDRGLEILGFPSNQFEEEPADNAEIEQFCRLNYGVTFPLFEKGAIRGKKAQPIFKYLTKEKGFAGIDTDSERGRRLFDYLEKERPDLLGGDGIKWNFTKFLIDREGNVVARFEPPVTPESMEESIKKLL